MSIRMAHIIAGLKIGGGERHLVSILNAMPGEHRAVICLGEKPSGRSFHGDLDPDIAQHFVRIRWRNLPIGIARLVHLLRKGRFDVVHTHMFGSNLYGACAARLARVPVVVTSELGENPGKNWFHRWLERHVISPLADLRFCVSPQILALRRDLDGVPASKLRLIVYGTTVPPVPAKRSASPVPLIGSVGRFVAAKDYMRLVEAFADLRQRGYRAQLCIVGDGPEMDRIKRAVEELHLSDVVSLRGYVASTDEWYQRFDIFVSSSIREGQPVALLEAMAHGLPVVVTDVGACAETVQNGVGGVVVPPGDSRALADGLASLLDDVDLRDLLARNARARVERKYSVTAVANYHIDCYRELLSNARAA